MSTMQSKVEMNRVVSTKRKKEVYYILMHGDPKRTYNQCELCGRYLLTKNRLADHKKKMHNDRMVSALLTELYSLMQEKGVFDISKPGTDYSSLSWEENAKIRATSNAGKNSAKYVSSDRMAAIEETIYHTIEKCSAMSRRESAGSYSERSKKDKVNPEVLYKSVQAMSSVINDVLHDSSTCLSSDKSVKEGRNRSRSGSGSVNSRPSLTVGRVRRKKEKQLKRSNKSSRQRKRKAQREYGSKMKEKKFKVSFFGDPSALNPMLEWGPEWENSARRLPKITSQPPPADNVQQLLVTSFDKCPVCEKEHNALEEMFQHLVFEHNGKFSKLIRCVRISERTKNVAEFNGAYCLTCQKDFPNEEDYLYHIAVEHSQQLLGPSSCGDVTVTAILSGLDPSDNKLKKYTVEFISKKQPSEDTNGEN
ncbi:Sulfate/thiosulfate import ATP-binding protein cysA [Trichinella spiralis]|uniref:Sulfate/thiosulfate import ATP-binding protein cysA n=1 Tax=Trichinella spiralis TaxID=6334 RepID=A0ABR3K8F1_TRISP